MISSSQTYIRLHHYPLTLSSIALGAVIIFALGTLQTALQASFIHVYDSLPRLLRPQLSRS